MSNQWMNATEERGREELEQEIENNKLDPWCWKCRMRMSEGPHFPPNVRHYFAWSAELNKSPIPEGGNDTSREGYCE